MPHQMSYTMEHSMLATDRQHRRIANRPDTAANVHDKYLKKCLDKGDHYKLPIAVLEKSDHFHKIKDARVALFPKLIEYIESDRIVFRYNSSQVINTRISHEYLLEFKDADDISYFFLQHDKRDDIYRGVTFFKKSNTDYTRGETIWTVLKIEKRQLENDCCEEIYRRPSYQEMFLDE